MVYDFPIVVYEVDIATRAEFCALAKLTYRPEVHVDEEQSLAQLSLFVGIADLLAVGNDPRVTGGEQLLYMRAGEVEVSLSSDGTGEPSLAKNLLGWPAWGGIAGGEQWFPPFKVEEYKTDNILTTVNDGP